MDYKAAWIEAETRVDAAARVAEAAYDGFLASRKVWINAQNEADKAESIARVARQAWSKEKEGGA